MVSAGQKSSKLACYLRHVFHFECGEHRCPHTATNSNALLLIRSFPCRTCLFLHAGREHLRPQALGCPSLFTDMFYAIPEESVGQVILKQLTLFAEIYFYGSHCLSHCAQAASDEAERCLVQCANCSLIKDGYSVAVLYFP